MSDLTDRAEQLLAELPTFPWAIGHVEDRGYPVWADDLDLVAYVDPPGAHYQGGAAGQFIAAAPALVADLLAEVKRLESVIERVSEANGNVHALRFAVERGELTKPDMWYAGIEYAYKRIREASSDE